eukprot:7381806-Prymnesium_polylepis.2
MEHATDDSNPHKRAAIAKGAVVLAEPAHEQGMDVQGLQITCVARACESRDRWADSLIENPELVRCHGPRTPSKAVGAFAWAIPWRVCWWAHGAGYVDTRESRG